MKETGRGQVVARGMLRQQVSVWTNPEGVPERFVYRARRFRITRTPLRWLARDSARADQAMWQVVAQDASGEVIVLDLYADSEQPSRWWAVDVRS
ncbi:hypothetical protein HQQ81_13910 [Microbacteriaceae bacterium VKM Ac-2854]|nr:hypothetical protein [Microbacteriaceae bacterium VKM Ac-2854]